MKVFHFSFITSLYLIVILALSPGCKSPGEIQISEETPKNKPKVVIEKSAAIIGGPKALQEKLVYPDEAKEKGIETIIEANVLVNETGKVETISFDTETEYGFEEAAENALYQVRFKPGERNGKPVSMFVTIPVEFKL